MSKPKGSEPETAHEPEFWVLCTEAECRELMAGRVPERVRDMARMVDWSLETWSMSFTGLAEQRQRKR